MRVDLFIGILLPLGATQFVFVLGLQLTNYSVNNVKLLLEEVIQEGELLIFVVFEGSLKELLFINI